VGQRKRKEQVKARKLPGQDKNCLVSEEMEEETKKTEEVMQRQKMAKPLKLRPLCC